MKKTTTCVALGLAACLAVVPLSACGLTATGSFDTAKKTGTLSSQLYIAESDLTMLQTASTAAALSGGESMSLSDFGIDVKELDTVTIDGKKYYTSNDESKGLSGTQKFTKKDLENAGAIFDDDKIVMYATGVDQMTQGSGVQFDDVLSGMDPSEIINFMTYELTFDKAPIATNGEMDGTTVKFDNLKTNIIWAAFTTKATKAKASSIKSSIKNKAVTKKQTVTFKTPGIVNGYVIDGKSVSPGAVMVGNTMKANTVQFAKEGKHKVTVKLTSGAKKKFTYTYDATAPTANVDAKATYKPGKKVTVKDACGLKSVKLDGKKVKVNGKKASKVLKKKGSHKLVATDKAGNKTTVSFKIK